MCRSRNIIWDFFIYSFSRLLNDKEKRRYFSNLRFFPYSCSRLSNEMDKKRYIPIPESQKSEYKRQPPMAAWLAHLNDNVKKFKPSPITGKLGKFLTLDIFFPHWMFWYDSVTSKNSWDFLWICLIHRVVRGSGAGPHTSKLATFFVMPLALTIPICNKKSHPTWAVECHKLFIEVTLLQWKFWDIPQLVSDVIFCCKSAYLVPRA